MVGLDRGSGYDDMMDGWMDGSVLRQVTMYGHMRGLGGECGSELMASVFIYVQ